MNTINEANKSKKINSKNSKSTNKVTKRSRNYRKKVLNNSNIKKDKPILQIEKKDIDKIKVIKQENIKIDNIISKEQPKDETKKVKNDKKPSKFTNELTNQQKELVAMVAKQKEKRKKEGQIAPKLENGEIEDLVTKDYEATIRAYENYELETPVQDKTEEIQDNLELSNDQKELEEIIDMLNQSQDESNIPKDNSVEESKHSTHSTAEEIEESITEEQPAIEEPKKENKKKKNSPILIILLFIFVFTFVYSGVNMIEWQIDNNNVDKITKTIEDNSEIVETPDNENVNIIEQEEEIPKENPYWDYIKVPLIDVNFDDLYQINNETVGWIQVKGTNINYPFVQTKDNSYYLKHAFDKSRNNAGWVFLDYRNDLSSINKNTIIYAHGRVDTTMFGSLKNILTSGWLKNKDNYIVRISTEYENTLWQVFSVYRIPTTNDYIRTKFIDDEDFFEFANMLKDRSAHNFNTNIQASDEILTLSTCYNSTDKVVLHAKLIKREVKQKDIEN